MRWVKDGPDVPIEVIRLAEEGRLALFCGAGVSQQAGLPGFAGLVEAVYRKLNRSRGLYPLEKKSFDDGDYDQVLAHLERALGNPRLVREKVAETLDLPPDADTGTHEALMTLATDGSGMCRLVTTNYDLGFSRYIKPPGRWDAAPRLPVPKPGRWNSVVHLHGYLGECGPNKEDLVLSSADFGTAYLVEGWATRFLRTLFQNYTVLFVGYRAEDVVVRYMLQALSTELEAKGDRPNAYAFAEIEGDEESTKLNWEARGIRPILYATRDRSHDDLHQTLRRWADRYSSGLLGRQNIVEDYMRQPPPDRPDETVDQVLWALKDGTGATAKFIAEQDTSPSPVPWLRTLDQNELFSLDGGALVTAKPSAPRSDALHPVTWQLACWLGKHLHEPEVLDWALSKGGCLDPRFSWIVREAIHRDGSTIAPDLKRIWSFLARPFQMGLLQLESYEIQRKINSGVWDFLVQDQVRAMLEPVFTLRRNSMEDIFRRSGDSNSTVYPLDVEVHLAGDEIEFILGSIRQRPDHDLILASLLSDCTNCLRRALEIQHHLETLTSDRDISNIWLESLGPITMQPHKPWVTLVHLASECIGAASRVNPPLARAQVDYWRTIDYAVFRRLVCYAFAVSGLFTAQEGTAYLFECGRVLWTHSCHNEIFRLLAHLWPDINDTDSRKLVALLLAGPPASLYRQDLPPDEVAHYSEIAIAERLAAMEKSGRALPDDALGFLSAFRLKHQAAQTADGDEQTPPIPGHDVASRIRDGRLTGHSLERHWSRMLDEDWQASIEVLESLAKLGCWPRDVWNMALARAIGRAIGGPPTDIDVTSVVDLIENGPDDFIGAMAHPLSQFLQFAPRAMNLDLTDSFWSVWEKIRTTTLSEPEDRDKDKATLSGAINTVPGHLTEALFEWIRQRSAKGNDEMPRRFWDSLERLILEGTENNRRCALGLSSIQLSWLFSDNPEWAQRTLLPSFSWDNPDEAAAAWSGFLVRPTMSDDLWEILGSNFIATFENTARLEPESARSLYHQVARIALQRPDWLSAEQCQRILMRATDEGRQQIAWLFWRALAAAKDKASALWRDRIGPWIEACWQPDSALKQADTSDSLLRVALATADAFPDAVDVPVRVNTFETPGSLIY